MGLLEGVVDKVIKRIFREAVTGGWRKVPNEEISNWNPSPNMNMLLMSKKIRQAEHVAHLGIEKYI
jgi:hypothetical protein